MDATTQKTAQEDLHSEQSPTAALAVAYAVGMSRTVRRISREQGRGAHVDLRSARGHVAGPRTRPSATRGRGSAGLGYPAIDAAVLHLVPARDGAAADPDTAVDLDGVPAPAPVPA
jgi:hypothetical protein